MLKKILIGLVVVIGGFAVFVATRPDTYHVERSATIAAPPEIIFAQLEDLKAWHAWSPWDKRDPDIKRSYSGAERGVGAEYAWQGNGQTGKGNMKITEDEAPLKLRFETHFIEPFPSVAQGGFDLKPNGDKTEVTWTSDGGRGFVGKFFGLFFSMDSMIGPDFEHGLQDLRNIAEAKAAKEKEAAAAKAAAAAAAQAATQAAAAAQPQPGATAAK